MMESEISIDLDSHTLSAAWRGLLLGVMIHTVQNVERATKIGRRCWNGSPTINKTTIHNESESLKWIEGGRGLVTWEEACETLGVNPESARKRLLEKCSEVKRKPGLNIIGKHPCDRDLLCCSHVQVEEESAA